MKFNLTRLSLFAFICVVSVATVMATPTCPTTTLANGVPPPAYENANGSSNGYVCDFGGLEFSNFHSSTPSLPPSSIGVQPGYLAGTTPANADPGFQFSGGWLVNSPDPNVDVNVSFTVTALTGLLTDVHIALDNSLTTGTGHVHYTEQICTPPGTTGCRLFVDDPTSGTLATDLILTTPVKSMSISKDLILSAGSNGSAAMSDFSNYYSHTVPEPRAVSVLLGLGFFGIMVFMKRRQAVRS